MMLMTLMLMLIAPQGCTEIKRQCCACTSGSGTPNCSTIGIACQPSTRLCRSRDTRASPYKTKVAKPKEG